MNSQLICSNCKSKKFVEKRGQHHFLESGLNNVFLQNVAIDECMNCGEKIISITNPNALMKKISTSIILKPYKLDGPEIKFLRKNLYLKIQEFAQLLGVAPVMESDWEKSQTEPTDSEDRLIRIIYAQYAKVDESTKDCLMEIFRQDQHDTISKYFWECVVYPELSCRIDYHI
ncbi:HTH cro/C1-type domain-containing protein [Candidatus Magnetomoraceae bacterium gMMP-15]